MHSLSLFHKQIYLLDFSFIVVIPACFDGPAFADSYKSPDDPLVINAIATVDIYPTALLVNYSGYREWTLVKVLDGGNETVLDFQDSPTDNLLRYTIRPGVLEGGLHKIYVKYYYYYQSYAYVLGWMYLMNIYPPPRAFIQGGSGRVAGPGISQIDARSGSYDLMLGPGHPETLNFSFSCHHFSTSRLEVLLSINLQPEYTFTDAEKQTTITWFYVNRIWSFVDWAMGTLLYNHISQISYDARTHTFSLVNSTLCKDPSSIPSPLSIYNGSCQNASSLGQNVSMISNNDTAFCSNASISDNNTVTSPNFNETCDLLSEYMNKAWDAAEFKILIDHHIEDYLLNYIVEIRELFEQRSNYLSAAARAFSMKLDSQFYNDTMKLSEDLMNIKNIIHNIRFYALRIRNLMGDYSNITNFGEYLTSVHTADNSIGTLPNAIYNFFKEAVYLTAYNVSDIQEATENKTAYYEHLYANDSCRDLTSDPLGYAEITTNSTYGNIYDNGYIITVKVSIMGTVSYFQQSLQIQKPVPMSPLSSGHTINGGIPKLNIQ